MIRHIITIFRRQFVKNKAVKILNFFVLSFGLSVLILMFFYLRNEFKYEDFNKNKDYICRVLTINKTPNGKEISPSSPPALGPALKEKYLQIKDYTRYTIVGDELLKTHNYSEVFKTAHCDLSFFNIFSFKLLSGSLDQFRFNSNVIVLTEKTGKKLFGNENPVGKSVKSGFGNVYIVIGILENLPNESHLKFDAITPYSGVHNLESWKQSPHISTYLLLRKNYYFNKENANIITHFLKDHIKDYPLLKFQALKDIHFNSDFDDPWNSNKGDKKMIFFLISSSILLIMVIFFNYSNSVTTHYISRIKEFSVKKIHGRSSNDILIECLADNSIFLFLSIIFSFVLIFFLANISEKIFDINLDYTGAGYLILLTVSVFFILMSLPILMAHYFNKINIKGDSLSLTVKPGHKPLSRIIGLSIQFFIATIVLFFAIVISMQLHFINNKPLGYNYDNIIYTPIYNSWRYDTEVIKEEILKNPNVISATATSNIPIDLTFKRNIFEWDNKLADEPLCVYSLHTDADFIQTFSIQIEEGNFFDKDHTFRNYWQRGLWTYVINEEAKKQMGLVNPVGTFVGHDNYKRKIVGVIADFHFKPLNNKIMPLFLEFNPENWLFLFIKLKKIDENTIEFIKNEISKFEDKGFPIEFKVLKDDIREANSSIRRFSFSITFFAFIAFVLSLIGLFSVITFLINDKQKVFAIKRVFGASANTIIKDFLINISWFLLPFIITAMGIGYYGTKKWLESFAYKIDFPFLLLSAIMLIIYVLVLLIIVFLIKKGIDKNPSKVLKYE